MAEHLTDKFNAMADRVDDLEAATRVRLTDDTVKALESWADALEGMGSRSDRVAAAGLGHLLRMHARLKALDAIERANG
jgi:hypothetical protein